MSGTQIHEKNPHSWITPIFMWTTTNDVFLLEVPIGDPDLVEFISTGNFAITSLGTKMSDRGFSRLIGRDTLASQLRDAIWEPAKLKPVQKRLEQGTEIIAHCHGVFLLGDNKKTLIVMVGRSTPVFPDTWIPASLKTSADTLLADHQAKVAKFEEDADRKRQTRKELRERYLPNDGFSDWSDDFGQDEICPTVSVQPILSLVPRAATFRRPKSGNTDELALAAIAETANSGWPPPRDGIYAGILPAAVRGSPGLVSWRPHTGLPSYPEVRWAVQKRLPSALRAPRIRNIQNPKFDIESLALGKISQVQSFDPTSRDLWDALVDLQLPESDYRDRIADVRKDVKTLGFEAIAWFQPYHVWTEDTWGIYFDASKLDDLALCFLDEFKSARVRISDSFAALLAFGLTYTHELFHAQVEAALSWLEINAQRPRHLRYKEQVYQPLRETPDWLEEALANWAAWNWFKAPSIQSLAAGMTINAERLDRIVEASLDLAPPGYQEWRLGNEPYTWRVFTNQLSTGKPKVGVTRKGLPLESLLTGPLPYDFLPADIPMHFVGTGLIADRLLCHPATLNVISRRELQKALKYFRHIVDPSAGKGSHEKWTGPDNRAFPVPRTDPVSYTVFKSFLQYIGIDKATYVREIRPKL